MREKQYRKKWLAEAEEAAAAAREAAQEELRKAGTGGGAVRMNTRQSLAMKKGFGFAEAAGAGSSADSSPPDPPAQAVQTALHSLREATLFDPDQPVSARIDSLQMGKLPIARSRPLTLRILRLVGDPKQPEDLRLAALQTFRRATFATRATADWRPTYLDTLRRVAQTENNAVSMRAREILAQEGDAWALETMQQGLRQSEEAEAPQLQAVQYLTAEDHGDHFDALRNLARKNRSQRVREEAIRGLASDPGSRDLLLDLLSNPKERTSIRQAALLSLRILDPDAYREQASRIIENAEENDTLRAASITTLRLDRDPGDSTLTPTIKKIEEESSSQVLRKAAHLYLPREE